jgi:hypothetical protein
MVDEKVLYEVKEKIAWITLNRPESLNAVNRDMVKSIVEYCRQAEEDRDVQVILKIARVVTQQRWLNRLSRRWSSGKPNTGQFRELPRLRLRR